MEKKGGKIIIFLILAGFTLNILPGIHLHAGAAYACEDGGEDEIVTESGNITPGCDEDNQDCTKDCSNCVNHNNCNPGHSIIPSGNMNFSEIKESFLPKEYNKFKNLNYPPDSPPS